MQELALQKVASSNTKQTLQQPTPKDVDARASDFDPHTTKRKDSQDVQETDENGIFIQL